MKALLGTWERAQEETTTEKKKCLFTVPIFLNYI